MKNIFVELFRFDMNTDYLPYYRKFNLKVDENISVNTLLEILNSKEEFGFEENCNLKINNLYLNSSELLGGVLEKLGNELRIEPISTYRSTKDLIINNSDYVEKTNILSKYLNSDELNTYLSSYELDYYASNTLNFNKDYIGEHVLYIAADIITSKPEYKDEVLNILDDSEKGIYYHTSLKNRVFSFDDSKEQKIQELLSMLPKIEKFGNRIIESSDSEICNTFSDFNIAVYEGGLDLNLKQLVLNSGAKLVELKTKDNQLPFNAFKVDEKFALSVAGEVLLEAKDSNADFILVADQFSFDTFDSKQKLIEKYMGRDIQLPIITRSEFTQLLQGNRDKNALGFTNHKVNVSFL